MPAVPATTERLGLPRYDNNVDPADFATQMNAVSDLVDALVARRDEVLPIGGQAPYGGVGDPAGGHWMLEDGRSLAIADYGELHAVIGFRYNPGGTDPGNGTFAIPDKRGRASVGADTMGTPQGAASRLTTAKGHANVLGQNGGAERHKLIKAELAVHDHPATQAAHSHPNPTISGWVETPGSAAAGTRMQGTPGTYYLGEVPVNPTGSAQPAVTVSNAGSDNEHNNTQPYEVDNWIIRVR